MKYKNELVLVDVGDGVATITMNRPERRNAMNPPMVEELSTALWGLDGDPSVRAIVVTGAGRSYCAGIDLSAGAEAFERDPESAAEADADMVVENFGLWRMRTPVIGAVHGAAIGAGITTALMFDVLFVAVDARLGFRFSRLGVLPEANSLWLLPRLIGVSRALDILLSGRDITGEEAVELGIAKAALPAEEVLPAAHTYARELATRTSPISTTLIKRLVNEFLLETDRTRAMVEETDWTWWTGSQPDVAEAVAAMTERRDPQWNTTKLDVPAERPPQRSHPDP